MIKAPLSLLFWQPSKPISLSCSFYVKLLKPWCSLWLFSGPSPACPSGTQHFKCSLANTEWGKYFFICAGDALVDAAQHPVSCLAAAASCSLMVSCLSTRNPRSVDTELLLRWVDTSLCCTSGLCFSRCKTLHLTLLNLIRFLLAHSSSLCRSPCRITECQRWLKTVHLAWRLIRSDIPGAAPGWCDLLAIVSKSFGLTYV